MVYPAPLSLAGWCPLYEGCQRRPNRQGQAPTQGPGHPQPRSCWNCLVCRNLGASSDHSYGLGHSSTWCFILWKVVVNIPMRKTQGSSMVDARRISLRKCTPSFQPRTPADGPFLVECRPGREPTHSCGVPITSDGYQMEEPGLQSLKPIEGAAFVYGHLLDSTYFKRA